ncbi:hypothetical protein L7F22_067435 [Adiantum nelumboides]|nr:hypothetical protein [Adiantum nelumboides]
MIVAYSPQDCRSLYRACTGGMAECRDFFDDSSAGPCRSSARNGTPSSNIPPHKEDVSSDCLELTLGPSNFSGSAISRPRLQHDVVRPPAYSLSQRQPSGNFASCLPATSYASQSPLLQTDGPKVPSGQDEVATGLGRQRSGNFACSGDHSLLPFVSRADSVPPVKALFPDSNSTFPSRDQIWQTLQKSGTLFEPTQLASDVSSMWSRRAASMQVVFSKNAVDDLEHCQIRRSCSNGVLMHAISHQVSNVESSLRRSPQQSLVPPSNPHTEEIEDLQKRKEMQAQRRLEARKRRRNLIGEKQHKKGKQNCGPLHVGSRQSLPSHNKWRQVGEVAAGEDDTALESNRMSNDETKFVNLDDSKKDVQELLQDSKCDMQASSFEDSELKSKATACAYDKCSSPPNGKNMILCNEHDSGSHGSMTSSELDQSDPMSKSSVASGLLVLGNEPEYYKSHAVTAINGHGRMSSSEFECAKAFLGSDADCMEYKGASIDAVKDGGGMKGVTLAGGSVECPPFLFSPMQYAYAVASATSTAAATQPISPVPYFTQSPLLSSCENRPTMQNSTTVHGPSPPAVNTFMGAIPLSSGALLARTTSAQKGFVEDSEEKRGSGERSAFLPISRSNSSLRVVFGESHYSGSHLDLQVSSAPSQLSSTVTVVSDTSNGKSMQLERQPSRPLGGRLLSQNSCVVDQAFISSMQEKSFSDRGVSVPSETPTFRPSNTNIKQEEGAKQEEASSESQLASEHSGADASYSQSTVIEKQRSGSFLDLPWVTTTGKGPNGKTINGFMYIANGRQVRLICSCHGKHMSAVEFVEHSGSSDLSNPERSIVVSPFPHFSHQVASTPV